MLLELHPGCFTKLPMTPKFDQVGQGFRSSIPSPGSRNTQPARSNSGVANNISTNSSAGAAVESFDFCGQIVDLLK